MAGPDACPACGGTGWLSHFVAAEMFDGERFFVRRCFTCGLLRTDGPSNADELRRYYHYDGGAAADARFTRVFEPLMRGLRRRRADEVTEGSARPGRVLDVGCGRGVMLEELQRRGWDVMGTELDAEVASSARARLGEQRVAIGDFVSVDVGPDPFQRIVFYHVLEHLPDPGAALQRAAQLLAPEGRVVIAVPNAASWQARASGAAWLHLDVPRHQWHFSTATLTRLCERHDLAIERLRSFSWEYGPYGWLQSGLARAGLGHVLFTDVLRAGRRAHWWHSPRVWAHAALVMPISAAGALAVPLEAIAAACGAGGSVVAVAKRWR